MSIIRLIRFNTSRLVIIQSLEPEEVETGKILREYLAALIEERRPGFPIDYRECESAVCVRRSHLEASGVNGKDGVHHN